MQVKDIASDGLIYALDPRLQKELGMSDMQQSLALKNILKAQDFDAIPLVDKFKGKITGLARRRLHDGDIHDVFILDVDEGGYAWLSSLSSDEILYDWEDVSEEANLLSFEHNDYAEGPLPIGFFFSVYFFLWALPPRGYTPYGTPQNGFSPNGFSQNGFSQVGPRPT